jgi:hypothetical protein
MIKELGMRKGEEQELLNRGGGFNKLEMGSK